MSSPLHRSHSSPTSRSSRAPLRRLRFALGLLLPLLLAACSGPADPLDAEINARSAMNFLAWQNSHEERLGPAAKKEFDEALQELRFELMGRARPVAAARMEETLRAELHGQTARSVLVRAWQRKHLRLVEERLLLRGIVRINANGEALDPETERKLEFTLQRQVARLDQLEEEITWLEKRLAALTTTPTPSPAP